MEAVTGVDYARIDRAGQQFRRPAGTVPDHDNVNPHRLQVPCGIDQRLTFTDGTVFFRELHHVRTQAAGRQRKAVARSRAVLEEHIDHHLAAQGRSFFDRPGADLLEPLSGVKNEFDFLPAQITEADEVLPCPLEL